MPTLMQVIAGALVLAAVWWLVRADIRDSKRPRSRRSTSRSTRDGGYFPYSNDSGISDGGSDCGGGGD